MMLDLRSSESHHYELQKGINNARISFCVTHESLQSGQIAPPEVDIGCREGLFMTAGG